MTPSKEKLIDELIEDGYLKTPAIIEAFKKIDRADFVLDEYKSEAYVNYPLPIGHQQTISQPLTVAFMIELLAPKKGEKILDVGAGSGWQTALLAEIVGDEGMVVGIERIPELKELAEKNISKYNFTEKGIVKLVVGDGSKGYAEEMPYDKIIAAASAKKIPQAWKDQLKIGGRIVAPVGSSIVVLDKEGQNQFSQKQYFGFAFVPLVEEKEK
jgi:protein-L-isoaspartate(D-aspartate) O-methyltransferase